MKISVKLLLSVVIALCVADVLLCAAGSYRGRDGGKSDEGKKDDRRRPTSDGGKPRKVPPKLKKSGLRAGPAQSPIQKLKDNAQMMKDTAMKLSKGATFMKSRKGAPTGVNQPNPFARQPKPWLRKESKLRPTTKKEEGGGKERPLYDNEYAQYQFLPVSGEEGRKGAAEKPRRKPIGDGRKPGQHGYPPMGPGHGGQGYPPMGPGHGGQGYPPMGPGHGGQGYPPMGPGHGGQGYPPMGLGHGGQGYPPTGPPPSHPMAPGHGGQGYPPMGPGHGGQGYPPMGAGHGGQGHPPTHPPTHPMAPGQNAQGYQQKQPDRGRKGFTPEYKGYDRNKNPSMGTGFGKKGRKDHGVGAPPMPQTVCSCQQDICASIPTPAAEIGNLVCEYHRDSGCTVCIRLMSKDAEPETSHCCSLPNLATDLQADDPGLFNWLPHYINWFDTSYMKCNVYEEDESAPRTTVNVLDLGGMCDASPVFRAFQDPAFVEEFYKEQECKVTLRGEACEEEQQDTKDDEKGPGLAAGIFNGSPFKKKK